MQGGSFRDFFEDHGFDGTDSAVEEELLVFDDMFCDLEHGFVSLFDGFDEP